MTVTTTTHAANPASPAELAGLAEHAGLDGLDAAGLLARVVEADRGERAAARDKLRVAYQWCVTHPATDPSEAAVWGHAGLPGLSECEEVLGGDGCPLVAAFAPEPFAAALGVSTTGGMQLLADALDLVHRLPRIWARVQRLEVPAWKARRAAQASHHLSREAAGFVDRQLVDRIATCGSVLIDRTVGVAAARFDPDQHQQAEQSGRDAWNVTVTHRQDGGWAGTSHLEATGDSLDLSAFYDLVCDHAAHLARLGDPDPLGVRKAKALGLIADAQTRLDLFGTNTTEPSDSRAGTDTPDTNDSGAEAEGPGEPPVRRPSLTKTKFYLHASLTDLFNLPDLLNLPDLPDGTVAVGEVERLGPATLAKIRDWLATTRATITPVLDLGRDDTIDAHDPPAWMRETVILRDRHCVFPFCTRDARACDLDHIEPYVPIDQGGPPGQTSPTRLAPLCRRHHRAKTSRRWSYRRERDGTYTWHGPHGLTFTVTVDTTTRTDTP